MGSLSCPMCCGRLFSNRNSLKYHLLSYMENIFCPVCKHAFNTIRELTEHLDDASCTPYRASNTVALSKKPFDDGGSSTVDSPSPGKTLLDFETLIKQPDALIKDNSSLIVADAFLKNEILVEECDIEVETMEDNMWEDANKGEQNLFYCSSCEININSVVEHISAYHPNQTVFYDTGVAVEQCSEFETQAEEQVVMYEENAYYPNDHEEFSKDDIPNDTKCNAESEEIEASSSHIIKIPSKNKQIVESGLKEMQMNRPKEKSFTALSQEAQNKILFQKNPLIDGPNLVEVDEIKMKGVLGTSKLVDDKSGIPYTRTVVQIEKFWESDVKSKVSTQVPKVVVPRNRKNVHRATAAQKAMVAQYPQEDVVQIGDRAYDIQNLSERLISPTKTINGKSINYAKKDVHVLEEQLLKKMFSGECWQPETPGNSSVVTEETEEKEVPVKRKRTKAPKKPPRESILKLIQDETGENWISTFTCNVCSMEFKTKDLFKLHKCHFNLECEICGFVCHTNRNFIAHKQTHSPSYKERLFLNQITRKLQAKPATCTVCNTTLASQAGLRLHQKMHRPDNVEKVRQMNNKNVYLCDLCNTQCFSERTFRIHYKIHVSDDDLATAAFERISGEQIIVYEDDSLVCKVCSILFETNDDLQDHLITHDPSDLESNKEAAEATIASEETVTTGRLDDMEEYFNCPICLKVFAEEHREIHMKMHNGESLVNCGKCNKKFPSQSVLDIHMKLHGPEVLECATCKMKFTNLDALQLHLPKHNTFSIERPYPCQYCGKRFGRPHEKVKHERVHTGERPYECGICGMKFRVGYCLKMHERIHSGVRPYVCEICDKSFRTRSGYKVHVSIHSEERLYACKLCPKTYKTPVQLAGHRKSHTKPYHCNICSRSFTNMYMLRNHLAQHEKVKDNKLIYKCDICSASYGREYALVDHMKTHNRHADNIPKSKKSTIVVTHDDASIDS